MPHWTTLELRTLRELYPSAAWPKIRAALYRHTDRAITGRAYQEGLRRASVAIPIAEGIVGELRRHRLAMGLSQSAVAERIGIDRASLVKAERRGRLPTGELLKRWAEALGFQLMLVPIEQAGQISDAETQG